MKVYSSYAFLRHGHSGWKLKDEEESGQEYEITRDKERSDGERIKILMEEVQKS